MNERELITKALKEHFLDKEQIRRNLISNRLIPFSKMKGTMLMKKSIIALISVITLLCFSAVTVFAINQIRNAKEAAQLLNYPLVASAFEQENSIKISKTVTEDGYTVSLLGITSGSNLTDFIDNTTKSYAVVAISNSDGSPIDEYSSVFVSPLVKGLNPALYNIATFNGSFSGKIDNGILYHMIECDNIEMFADRGIYLCVSDSELYDSHAFNFDKASGVITPNMSYEGLNVLFDLPIDKAKADPEKANDYIDSLFEPDPDAEKTEIPENEKNDIPKNTDGSPDIDAIISTSKLVEGSKQTLKANEYGEFRYKFEYADGGYISAMDLSEQIFEQQKVGVPFLGMMSTSANDKNKTQSYLIYTLQSDNSLDVVIYEQVSPL